MSTASAAQPEGYPPEFITRVVKTTRNEALGHLLRRRMVQVEGVFVSTIFSETWGPGPLHLDQVVRLYKEYQEIRRKIDPSYTALADFPRDQRPWSDAEHILLAAVLGSDFTGNDLLGLHRAYRSFIVAQEGLERTLPSHERKYHPAFAVQNTSPLETAA